MCNLAIGKRMLCLSRLYSLYVYVCIFSIYRFNVNTTFSCKSTYISFHIPCLWLYGNVVVKLETAKSIAKLQLFFASANWFR